MFLAIYDKNIDWVTGVIVSIIAILIVFAVLLLIICCVKLLSVFCKNVKDTPKEVKQSKKFNKLTDIKDEDMMVAALIATIDYSNETKKDVRLVSIKQIS